MQSTTLRALLLIQPMWRAGLRVCSRVQAYGSVCSFVLPRKGRPPPGAMVKPDPSYAQIGDLQLYVGVYLILRHFLARRFSHWSAAPALTLTVIARSDVVEEGTSVTAVAGSSDKVGG